MNYQSTDPIDPTDPAYIYFMEHHNNHDIPFVTPVPEPSSAIIFGTIVIGFLMMRYLTSKRGAK